MSVRFGALSRAPTILDLLRVSLGIHAVDGKVVVYKRVLEGLRSEYDRSFIYPPTGVVEFAYNPDPSKSCAAGGHFSTNENWPVEKGYKVLVAEVCVSDIICCLDGKIRVKKAKILGVADED